MSFGNFKKLILASFLLAFLFLVSPVPGYVSSNNPVLIVPGIGASWNWQEMIGGPLNDSWSFFPGVHIYDSLIEALEVEGFDVHVIYYDWRKSNLETSKDFLKKKIDEIKLKTGSNNVDIVAHSMGGLVSRAYIQSNDFEDDVERFVMLGTPNHGSSDIYSVWEGGVIPKNWGRSYKIALDSYLWFLTHLKHETGSNYETIHEHIPSLGEMMPVYAFLEEIDLSGSTTPISYESMEVKNPFLEDLENSLFLLQTRVYTSNLSGFDEATVDKIIVEPRLEGEEIWKDGKPNPFPPPKNNAEGDNRVLDSSVNLMNLFVIPGGGGDFPGPEKFIEFGFYRRGSFSETNHTYLPHRAIEEVIYWLKHEVSPFPSPMPEIGPPVELPEVNIPEPSPEPDKALSFFFTDKVEPKIISPDGSIIDVSTSTIPLAEFETCFEEDGPSIIYIPEPEEGEYIVEVMGLDFSDYDFGIYYADESKSQLEDFCENIEEGEIQSFNIEIYPDEVEPIKTDENYTIDDLINLVKGYYKQGRIKEVSNCSDPYLEYESIKKDKISNLKNIKMGKLLENNQACFKLETLIETDNNDYQGTTANYEIDINAFQENDSSYFN